MVDSEPIEKNGSEDYNKVAQDVIDLKSGR